MRLLLAPMEGMLDCVLRDVLTRIGGYDHAVSEFVRVSGTVLPPRTYQRLCPELERDSRTPAGVPVAVQLLGSDPALMAANAGRLSRLAPWAVDLNFGCPAKVVNRHGGGAMLLDTPERLHEIVSAVRDAVPGALRVTAKMRLGVADPGRAVECAQALAAGGAAELVVHARTRDQAYRAPAHWEWVARVAAGVPVPVVANGEVWTTADWQRCRQVSGVPDVMCGRGAVADPWLGLRIRGLRDNRPNAEDWQALKPHLGHFWQRVQQRAAPVHACGRVKLWLGMLRRHWPQAEALLQSVRALNSAQAMSVALISHGIPLEAQALPQEAGRGA